MIKTPINLQDLRKKIYIKAKAEKDRKFWGLYIHVCKMETLKQSYVMAKSNKGAPGIDGETFEMIEAKGLEHFLKEIQNELKSGTYYPERRRKVLIPKSNGKKREFSIPTIKDRVVEGALKLILEPIFEADFMPGSFGYRPKKNPAEAVERIAEATIKGKTRIIDVDLKSYFDSIVHAELFKKVAMLSFSS